MTNKHLCCRAEKLQVCHQHDSFSLQCRVCLDFNCSLELGLLFSHLHALNLWISHGNSSSATLNKHYSCAHVLYGLRTLRSHGMPTPALHAVFQSTAMAKVTLCCSSLVGIY